MVQDVAPQRVAVAGLGSIGKVVASAIAAGEMPRLVLSAVSAANRNKAREWLQAQKIEVPVVALDELEPMADLVIECAPADLLEQSVRPFLEAGKQAVVLSVGALLYAPQLLELAQRKGAVLMVPTGALVGLDAVLAAAQGTLHRVSMVTRKPPASYEGAPHVVQNDIALDAMTQPVCIFSGTARQAAQGFPANVNVVAALALAGAGPDKTWIEIWADPGVTRNTHTILVESDAARMTMAIEGIAGANPKTSKIVAQSVVALLKKKKHRKLAYRHLTSVSHKKDVVAVIVGHGTNQPPATCGPRQS